MQSGILATLESTGKFDNTIVVFAGDNVCAPGTKAGIALQPIYLYELYSRLCKYLNLATPSGVEGPGAPRAVRIGPLEEHNLWGGAKAWPTFQIPCRTICRWTLLNFAPLAKPRS